MGPNQDLSQTDWLSLMQMRKDAQKAGNQALQDLLAGYEHRAYARETSKDNPWMGASIAVSTPLYQLAKLAGLTNSRSAPSLSQMGQGLLGVGEGLLQRWK